MASVADLVFAQVDMDERKKLYNEQRKLNDSIQNRRNKMGIGRLVGGGLGLLGASALGLGPLGLAFGAAVGSRLGNEFAQSNTNIDQVEEGKLYREAARKARKEGIEAERALNRSANVQMLTDAFSAYTLGGGENLLQDVKDLPGRARTFLNQRKMGPPPSIGVTKGSNIFMNPTMPPAPNPLVQAMNTTGTDLITKNVFNQSQVEDAYTPMNTDDDDYNRLFGIAPMLGDLGRRY
tara:strand:- start:318 stop:1025 length:708 start_codon:yes stop_codon:yes gene_type:complete